MLLFLFLRPTIGLEAIHERMPLAVSSCVCYSSTSEHYIALSISPQLLLFIFFALLIAVALVTQPRHHCWMHVGDRRGVTGAPMFLSEETEKGAFFIRTMFERCGARLVSWRPLMAPTEVSLILRCYRFT